MTKTCPVCNSPVSETDAVCPACGFKLQGTTQAFQFISEDGNTTVSRQVTIGSQATPAQTREAVRDADFSDEDFDEPTERPAVHAAHAAPAHAAPPATRKTVLTVVRGPQTGVAFVLEPRVLVVGRDPKCDIFLNDMTVSRDHARIEPVGGTFQIIDDDSFNGVWVNNENVHTALLHDGDFVQIGAFALQVSVQ